MKIVPIILSGGLGKRLWPLSNKAKPKQYLALTGNKTMLQETILRLNGLDNLADPIIICNYEHRFIMTEQCRQINIINPTILLESTSRNTAPAITAAALQSVKSSDNALLLVLSADHVIQDIEAFHSAINIAAKQANEGKLVTFGVNPTDANTGYGYIKVSQANGNSDVVHRAEYFVEKPDTETAKIYLEQGNYLWNSGMFMFSSGTLIDELNVHSPNIVNSVTNAVNNAKKDHDFILLSKKDFESSPSISIDCALMEKSSNIFVVPLDAQWRDIGGWSAMYDFETKDKNNNVLKGNVISKDTSNVYIVSNKDLVVTNDVRDLLIVDTDSVTLVSSKKKGDEASKLVEELAEKDIEQKASKERVYRPWGWYRVMYVGNGYKVKKISIEPGENISLQFHRKRSEHWVVVNGIATITKESEVFSLNTCESITIPVGVKHSIENNTKQVLEIIETQCGSYLEEDDIIRIKDKYGRV